MKIAKKVIITLIIVIVIILLVALGYKFGYKVYLVNNFFSRPIVETSADYGEYAELISDNLKVAISNINCDVENKKLSYEIEFSRDDGENISSMIVYDWIIYDANKNIIANNSVGISSTPKKKFFLGFSAENYNSTSFKVLTDHTIGYVSGGNLMSDIGIIKQGLEGSLNSIPQMPLTIRIANLTYTKQGEQEKIMPDADFIFTFN